MNQQLSYRVLRSSRKTVAIQITPQGEVLVRCPRRTKEADIRAFVESKAGWIRRNLEKLEARPRLPLLTRDELTELALQAREDLSGRAARFAPRVGVSYGRITIRAQRSRWGSCSAEGNLSFNCLLMLCPDGVRDYVVVHELCHRKQMNHSPLFWAEVERILPSYPQHRQWLREHGPALIARLEN